MSELSTLAKVKNVLRAMPIGSRFTTQDLCDHLPKEDRNTVFTAVSALRLMGCLESLSEKAYALIRNDDGSSTEKMLTIYQLRSYPLTDDYDKPAPYTRGKKEQTTTIIQQAFEKAASRPSVEPETKVIPAAKKKPYNRVFAGTWTQRLPEQSIQDLGNSVIYMSDRFINDFALTNEAPTFELGVAYALKNFDPATDVVVFFGDTLVVAMAIFYLSTRFKEINIGRWSTHDQNYKIRRVKLDSFKI